MTSFVEFHLYLTVYLYFISANTLPGKSRRRFFLPAGVESGGWKWNEMHVFVLFLHKILSHE